MLVPSLELSRDLMPGGQQKVVAVDTIDGALQALDAGAHHDHRRGRPMALQGRLRLLGNSSTACRLVDDDDPDDAVDADAHAPRRTLARAGA
jgi:hypothetical protein